RRQFAGRRWRELRSTRGRVGCLGGSLHDVVFRGEESAGPQRQPFPWCMRGRRRRGGNLVVPVNTSAVSTTRRHVLRRRRLHRRGRCRRCCPRRGGMTPPAKMVRRSCRRCDRVWAKTASCHYIIYLKE
ncbi:unnamed protein product, partial [Pylaiella littoralis]